MVINQLVFFQTQPCLTNFKILHIQNSLKPFIIEADVSDGDLGDTKMTVSTQNHIKHKSSV